MVIESRPDDDDPPGVIQVVVGETLRELRLLSDAEWEAIPEAERPSPAERVEGLGWIVAAIPGSPRTP